nr:hypothetical protein GCM10020092_062460 [Actinoplanes digitatis]
MSTSRQPSPGLLAALAAGGLLLAVPAAGSGTPPTALVSAAAAWPQAQRGTVQPKLADGTEYRPGIFLDARTSVGTAETPDGRFLRLVLLGADDSVRELRRLPRQGHPSFQTFAVAGDDLVWVEGRAERPSGAVGGSACAAAPPGCSAATSAAPRSTSRSTTWSSTAAGSTGPPPAPRTPPRSARSP